MSENFSDFGPSKNNSRPFSYSSNSSSPSSSSSSENHRKLAEKIERIDIGNYGDKSLQELILKKVEKVAENIEKRLETIKRNTEEDDFRLRIRNILKTLKNTETQANTQIINIKKFVDIYVKKKNNKENKTDVFIPGLDDNRKLGRFDLPDIIGFTKDEAVREENAKFLRELSLRILGLPEDTLQSQLEKLGNDIKTESSNGLENNLDSSGSLPDLDNVNKTIKGSSYTLIYYWRLYAQLLNMISKEGKVDFEIFMRTRKTDDDGKKNKSKDSLSSLLLRGGKFKGKKSKHPKDQKKQQQKQKGKQKQQQQKTQDGDKQKLSASDQKLFNLVSEIEGWYYDRSNVMNNIRTKGKERYKYLLLKLIDKYLEHIKVKYEGNNSSVELRKCLPYPQNLDISREDFYKEMSTNNVKELTYFRQWLSDQDSWFGKNITSENNILDVLTYKSRKSGDKKEGSNKYLYMISKGAEQFYNQYDIGYFASVDQDPIALRKLRDKVITGVLTYLITIRKVYLTLINRLESIYSRDLSNRSGNKNQKRNIRNNESNNTNNGNENNNNENNNNNHNEINNDVKQKQIQQMRNMLSKIKEQLKSAPNAEKRAKLLEIRGKVISKLKELD
jgi:hypothetical protein